MRRFARALGLAAAATLLSSCGLLGASSEPEANTGPGPELKSIRIALLPIPDAMPVYWAVQAGYFAAEGLDVTTRGLLTCSSGANCVDRLVSGEAEVTYSSWTPFLTAMATGLDVRPAADATVLADGNSPIMVSPTSGITSVKQLAGKRIAISDRGTASELLTASLLKINGVDPGGVQWVSAPFPQIPLLLKNGEVDAAYLTEPYTKLAGQAGAIPIADTNLGPNKGLPLSGYAVMGTFAGQKPKTVAAFQRALARATEELRVDRPLLNKVAQSYIKINRVPVAKDAPLVAATEQEAADVLNLASLNTFRVGNIPSSGLRRVYDLMREFNALRDEITDLDQRILAYAPTG